MTEEENEMSSLRKKSPVSLSYSFNQHRQAASFDITNSTSSSTIPQRSPSTWGVKSKTNTLLEIKGKSRSFISRIHRHSSVDLSYNRLNYSLNLEDDHQPSPEDDFRTKKLPSMRTMPFDHHPPRLTPRRREDQCPTPKAMATGNLELRRGFEALSATMNSTNTIKKPPLENNMAEVRKGLELGLEEITSPGGISPNRDVLVVM